VYGVMCCMAYVDAVVGCWKQAQEICFGVKMFFLSLINVTESRHRTETAELQVPQVWTNYL
jgi:hypothetical protein